MALTSQGWLAGTEFGSRFSDVRFVHAGSRFSIYEAHEAGANRTVIIKIPDPAGASWLHDVLLAEAAVLAAIGSHPNVVSLYQQITVEDGRPALVLERCRGSLEDTKRTDEPTPMREVTAIGIKLAGALETAHRAGVVHCAVRPGNVLVTEWGEPALAGFDEAVRLDVLDRRPPLHQLTAHTAPEVLEGGRPTTASDVYGLASTLYELAAGRAAFRTYVGESPASVMLRVLSSPVLPIVSADVPLELSDLLTWALSPDPARRPPSPSWLADELARIERRMNWPRTRMVTG
jgi:serine/threonine protein kinase